MNCTPPEHVVPLLTAVADDCPVPLVAYPNSGETWDGVAKRWRGGPVGGASGSPVVDWLGAGARVVGGCCRVGPAEISGIADALAGVDGGRRSP